MSNRATTDSSAVDHAVRTLRRMIFDGTLPANQPLRQDDLAAEMGTSRHPVREALGRLSGEGLVTFRARRGYVVTALSAHEINDIFEMRAVLEEHAAYLATVVRSMRDADELGQIVDKMGLLKDGSALELAAWSELNRNFHSRLFVTSGQRHLCRIIETLRDSVESYIRLTVANTSLVAAWITHKEIFDAFRAGDAPRVARLSRQHVRHSAHHLLSRLQPRQNATEPRAARTEGRP